MASFGIVSDMSGPIVPASQLEAMAVSMGVPKPFVAWLSEQGLTTPEELAMVCSKESEIETALLSASGVPLERLIDRVSVTELWLLARSRVDKSVALQSGKMTHPAPRKFGGMAAFGAASSASDPIVPSSQLEAIPKTYHVRGRGHRSIPRPRTLGSPHAWLLVVSFHRQRSSTFLHDPGFVLGQQRRLYSRLHLESDSQVSTPSLVR